MTALSVYAAKDRTSEEYADPGCETFGIGRQCGQPPATFPRPHTGLVE